MGLLWSRMHSQTLILGVGHGFLWVLGVVGIFVAYRRVSQVSHNDL